MNNDRIEKCKRLGKNGHFIDFSTFLGHLRALIWNKCIHI